MNHTVADIGNLIITYYPRLRKIFRSLVSIRNIPISLTQLTGLSIVAKAGKLTMSDLADELCMSNQQLTKVVDALCKLEMVERVTGENNRRKVYAQITSKGVQTLSDFNSEVNAKLVVMLGNSPDTETDNLYQCFAHIAAYLDAADKKLP